MRNPVVLLIEDSDEDFEVTVNALRLANLRSPVMRCANERDVSNFLNHEDNFESSACPSLILLDLNLAGADGRKLLKRIREKEWLRSVPITILTTSSNPTDIELCYRSGGNAYLIKPVNLDRFEIMIQNLISFWFDTAALPNTREARYAKFSY